MSTPAACSALSSSRPFPGLRPYCSADHPFFFGREDQSYALYRLLDRNRFIAVVGSSGSGKSSLVRAGLLPLLDEETQGTGGRSWHGFQMQPGDAPIEALVSALAGPPPLFEGDEARAIHSARRERIALALNRSSFGLNEALDMLEVPADHTVYLLVDQFEELFRFAANVRSGSQDWHQDGARREAAARFVQLLLQASRNPARAVHVLITLRSDFIGDCARFQGLPEAICAAQFLVPNLTRDQREEVIRRPVEAAGSTIACELVERLLNDGSEDMDQLPVLQHCLMRIWDAAGRGGNEAEDGSAKRQLTLDHYREVGGLAGAISKHANEVLNDLRDCEAAVAAVFRVLCELDREGRIVRRPVTFGRIGEETGLAKDLIRRVIDRFRSDDCSFLVPSLAALPQLQDETRVDVGHEALLRNWEKISASPAECLKSGPSGWVWDEDRDRRTYQALLSLVDTAENPDQVTLPLDQAEARWTWWMQRPRNNAWAERYGGGIERVRRLLETSRERSRRRRTMQAAMFGGSGILAVPLLLFVIYLGYQESKLQFYKGAGEKLTEASMSVEPGPSSNGESPAENVRPRKEIADLWKFQTATTSGGEKTTSLLAGTQGYMWIGNRNNQQLQSTGTPAQPVLPDTVRSGSEYAVNDDTYLREALPDQSYRSQKVIGVIPQGTRVKALENPIPFERKSTQYWLKVLVVN
ncbi:MAG: hypothetical protein FIA97_12790 [Methylococcaceae bacterium]|nr:hypothetical protein [Methylococcaceae bacterium]